MSNYAIIQLAGRQYLVNEGDQIIVDRQEDEAGKNIVCQDVLLVRTDSETLVGQPTVKGAEVTLEVVEHNRGPKLRVTTYKAKSRYRKVKGYKHSQTVLNVSKIKHS